MNKPKLKNLAEEDFQALVDAMGGLLDKQAATLASKQDLTEAEHRIKTELKDYMNEGFESVIAGMDSIADKLAEKERVENLENWALKSGYQTKN